jgi:hypothetical protein
MFKKRSVYLVSAALYELIYVLNIDSSIVLVYHEGKNLIKEIILESPLNKVFKGITDSKVRPKIVNWICQMQCGQIVKVYAFRLHESLCVFVCV